MIEIQTRELLLLAWQQAIAAVAPAAALAAHWPRPPAAPACLKVLAIGKAGAAMAQAAVAHYGTDLRGLVLVPDGHRLGIELPSGFRVLESAHPLPDARSLQSAEAALNLVRGLGESDLLLVLLSGGGSSVMAKPRAGITLADKQELTRQLQERGASIVELNCLRSQLSAIKGGRLAAACDAPVVTLAISDVPGNDAALIASGPTLRSRTTPAEAAAVLQRFDITANPAVAALLARAPDPAPLPRAADRFTVVASGMTMLAAVQALLESRAYRVVNLGDAIGGDARTLARDHAAQIVRLAGQGPAIALLSGGETTVSLKHAGGRGGRNSEYLLQLALALDGKPDVWALAADSDGIDGYGGHAGALLAPDSLTRARSLGLDATAYLERNDSAAFFDALGDVLMTGPTQTNVNDLRLLLFAAGA